MKNIILLLCTLLIFLLFGSFTDQKGGEIASVSNVLTAQFIVVNDWGSEMTDIYIEHKNYLYGKTDKIILDRLKDGEKSMVYQMNFIPGEANKSDLWFIKFSADDLVWTSKPNWHCKLMENDSNGKTDIIGLITIDGVTSSFIIKPPESKLCDAHIDEI